MTFAVRMTQPVLRKIAKSDVMKWHVGHSMAKQAEKNQRAEKAAIYIAGFSVASMVIKDAIGCYYYVTQSLKNKKIPDEKRKFVAALDLVNGVVMIATQIILTLTLAKFQKKLFDKHFDKYFNSDAIKKLTGKILNDKGIKKGTKEFWTVARSVITNTKNIKNICSTGFAVITSLIGATVIAKRVIVPFIATPLATWAKVKIIDRGETKPTESKSQCTKNLNLNNSSRLYFQNNKNIAKLYEKIKTNT